MNRKWYVCSCWQGANLAGTVRLVVWEGPAARWSHHASLGALVLAAALALHVAQAARAHVQRRHNLMLYAHM